MTADNKHSDRARRVREVVGAHLRSRAANNVLPDEKVVEAHPELMPELAQELKRAQLILDAKEKAQAAMDLALKETATTQGNRLTIRCPNCRNPIALYSDAPRDEIDCPLCGSRLTLINDRGDADARLIGSMVGHFLLSERVGTGAFGNVWKAWDTELERTVAVKIPRLGQLSGEESEKFIREARSAARLNHPQIVSVHEVGRDGDTFFIVSDYVNGIPLSEYLGNQAITPREAADLVSKIAGAVHHAHEAGIVHRDVKPSNIMIDEQGEPHVMDFGLAKREATEIAMTLEGQVFGTPAYMSPEQARGDSHRADPRSDIYSIGVMLFEMLTGELPFRGTARMLLEKMIHDEPPSPRRIDRTIPKDLETICLKCLEKDPHRRFVSAKELAEELNRFLCGEAIRARSIPVAARMWRWCKRKPVIAALSFSLVLAFTLGFAGAAWQWRLANQNLRVSDLRLAQMLTERGVRAALEGKTAHAMSLWANAVEIREKDDVTFGRPDTVNRLRLAIHDLYLSRPWAALDLKAEEQDPHTLSVSLDGRSALSAKSVDEGYRERLSNVVVWNLESGSVSRKLPVVEADSVYFSPGARLIVTQSKDTTTVWSAETGAPLDNQFDKMSSQVVAISDDESWMVTTRSSNFDLWHLQSKTYKTLEWPWYHVNYFGTGGYLYSCSRFSSDYVVRSQPNYDPNGGITLKSIERIHLERNRRLNARRIDEVRFCNGGSHLIINSETGDVANGSVSIWHLPSGKLLSSHATNDLLQPPTRDKRSVINVVRPDGEYSVLHRSQSRRLEDTQGGRFVWDNPESHTVNAIPVDAAVTNVSTDGHTLIANDVAYGRTVIWKAGAGLPRSPRLAHDSPVAKATFNPHGRLILTAASDNTARIWSVAGGTEIAALQHDGAVVDAEWLPDRQSVVTGSRDGTVRVWRMDSMPSASRTLPHDGPVLSLDVKSTGGEVLTSCENGTAYIWDVDTGELTCRLAHGASLVHAIYSSDGHQIATAGIDGVIQLWRYVDARWTMQHRFDVASEIQQVAFSPNGRKLVVGCLNGTAILWDTASGESIGRPLRHGDSVTSVVFSPDASHVATASLDSTARLWSADDGSPESSPLRHEGPVQQVAYSRDGSLLATAAASGAAHLWEASTGLHVGPPVRHEESVSHVSFVDSDRLLVTASDDGTARVWALPVPIETPTSQIVETTRRRVMGRLDASGELRPTYPDAWPNRILPSDRPFLAKKSFSDDEHKLFLSWSKQCIALEDWEAAWTNASLLKGFERHDEEISKLLAAARAGMFWSKQLPATPMTGQAPETLAKHWQEVSSRVHTAFPQESSVRGIDAYRDVTASRRSARIHASARRHDNEPIFARLYDVRAITRNNAELESLRRIIESCLAPYSWRIEGGKGFVSCRNSKLSLYIVQTKPNHDAIERLLDSLHDSEADVHGGVPIVGETLDNDVNEPVARALRQSIELSSPVSTLDEVVAALSAELGIEIVVDQGSLDDVSLGEDSMVSMPIGLRNSSAADYLALFLRDLHLTYLVRRGAIFVTTPETVEESLELWVYPVQDFVTDGKVERLIAMVTSAVAPDAWDEVGGSGVITYVPQRKCLVVSQTQVAQRKLQQLLTTLRSLNQESVAAIDLSADVKKQQLLAALQRRIDVDLGGLSLVESMALLSAKLGADVVLDRPEVNDLDLSIDSTVPPVRLQNASVEDALILCLRELRLTHVVRNGFVFVTSRIEGEEALETWAHPVHDLVDSHAQADSMMEMITSQVEPNSWGDVGGAGVIDFFPERQSLVISNTYLVQRKVSRLMSNLRNVNPAVVRNRSLSETKQAILAGLQQPIDVDFRGQSLGEVVASLADKLNVDFFIDPRALDDLGVSSKSAVPMVELRDCSAEDALTLVLQEFNLTHAVMNSVVLVTSHEVAEELLDTWVYPVQDLVEHRDEAESLVDAISSTVDPALWDDVGGPGAMTYFAQRQCLVVTQQHVTQRKIQRLLRGIRKPDQTNVRTVGR